MASSETRHAAWQTERRFAVRLSPEGGPPTELADGLTEFLDAFDLAFDWLNREDPTRTGAATLAIVETSDGVSEEVWTYPPLPTNGLELTERLGFNPANWAGVPGYAPDERKSRLRQRVGASDPRDDEAPWRQIERAVTAHAAPSVEPSVALPVAEPVVAREPALAPASAPASRPAPTRPRTPKVDYTPKVDLTEPAALYVTARKWIRVNVPTAWDDRLSRYCLILSGASLWFTLGLADPQFLAPLLVCVPALTGSSSAILAGRWRRLMFLI